MRGIIRRHQKNPALQKVSPRWIRECLNWAVKSALYRKLIFAMKGDYLLWTPRNVLSRWLAVSVVSFALSICFVVAFSEFITCTGSWASQHVLKYDPYGVFKLVAHSFPYSGVGLGLASVKWSYVCLGSTFCLWLRYSFEGPLVPIFYLDHLLLARLGF